LTELPDKFLPAKDPSKNRVELLRLFAVHYNGVFGFTVATIFLMFVWCNSSDRLAYFMFLRRDNHAFRHHLYSHIQQMKGFRDTPACISGQCRKARSILTSRIPHICIYKTAAS
jgi:hypothetical protein